MGMEATDSRFHVLAVDDSLIERKVIEGLLKKSYQVTAVDSGSKALEFLGFHQDGQSKPSVLPNNHQEVEVNLIITDYCMPGMTGYDLLKKIKESSVLKDIPVVIMSSENVPSRISQCLEEGAEEFFLKPVKEQDVVRLRAHMMKTKYSNHQKAEIFEAQSNEEELASQTLEVLEQGQEPPQQQQSNSNKRKAMEEEISSDRTRPRYNGNHHHNNNPAAIKEKPWKKKFPQIEQDQDTMASQWLVN